MVYQTVIAIGLIVFTLNVILNLRHLKSASNHRGIPGTAPLVSVLVPARNEEENIQTCLESLRKQDYPNFEILVLDDSSTDRTAEIVEKMAARHAHLQLIRGEPLPAGWMGKPFACYQLAKKAGGEWLLFIDADTVHEPTMLSSVLGLALELELKPSLLSGFPHQLASSLEQKIAIPVFYFIIMSWMPLWWLQRSKVPQPSMANGQFLLFPREEYWRIGGHEVVKARIMEDLWLGAEVHRQGGRVIAVDLSPVVACHMYNSFGAMWHGFAKSIYGVAAMSAVGLAGLMVMGFLFYLAPFCWLVYELFAGSATPSLWWVVVAAQVVLIILMRWLVDRRFREPAISAFLHPFGLTFFVLNGIYASSRRALGSGIEWKGRQYNSRSGRMGRTSKSARQCCGENA